MKIKVLEETGIRHENLVLSHGDSVTISDHLGKLFCNLGWAEDEAGVVATGKRDLNPKRISPESLIHPVSGGMK